MNQDASERTPVPFRRLVLLGAVFLIANSGLVYELLAGTVSAYLVGSAVLQFSLVVGIFLAAMGLGAFVSRYVETELIDTFVRVEIAIGIFGGASALILYTAFGYLAFYTPVLYGVCAVVGALVGMEIPIVMRLLEEELSFKVNVATVLGVDYLGALTASVAFPLICLPLLGQMATAFFFGAINVVVALICIYLFWDQFVRPQRMLAAAVVGGVFVTVGLVGSSQFEDHFSDVLYNDTVVLRRTSEHQNIVVTKWRGDVRMYLDGNLQFSTADEHRYHETLVHTALGFPGPRNRVLVLGAGDGMAAREILKYPDVEEVVVVELDSIITELFSEHRVLRELNDGALNDPRVRAVNRDAMEYLKELEGSERFHRIVADFPDPNNPDVGKLYSQEFYRLLFEHLSGDGYFITQASSPFQAPKSYWCIAHTVESVAPPQSREGKMFVHPLHAYVPSLGDWGFVLASPRPIDTGRWEKRVSTKYLSPEQFSKHFVFPEDLPERETRINHFDSQVLVRYYDREWEHRRILD